MRLPTTWLPAWLSDGDGDGSPGDELQNWSSLIGIVTAICGNVLIALALNVQRYAHIRLHRKKLQIRERAKQGMGTAGPPHGQAEGRYGAASRSNGDSNGWADDGSPDGVLPGRYSEEDAGESSETEPLTQSFRSDDDEYDKDNDSDAKRKGKVSSTYLKDPYWWLGQVLITVGEMGNFLAYGFAPASIVSPLGVVALVSNCVIAPIFFKEAFRQRDFWGVLIAITGAVTVVLSAKTEETKLGPHEVWDAITTMEFEIYMGVSCGLIVLLMWLSPRYGNRTILIDLGLVGLFGGYTVLATKGVSSMLSSTLLGLFTTPVTYVLVFILLSTAIMQVRYVNKALQRFDSTQVIPIQFVLFTLSVIIGSAVLYRDFERTTAERAVKFVGGCLFTFFGVFLITSGRPRQNDNEEAALSDAEGIEETIGLAEHDAVPPSPASSHPHLTVPSARPRGSSQGSRLSFSDAIMASDGYPTPRAPPRPKPHPLPDLDDGDDNDREESHLLGGTNPWHRARDDPSPSPNRPTLGLHTISSDTVVSYAPSSAVSDRSIPPPQTPPAHRHSHSHHPSSTTTLVTPPRISLSSDRTPATVTTPNPRISVSGDRPATASTPGHRHHHHLAPLIPPPPPHVYSPSPFSSTLSAVVGDKLLAHMDGTSPGAVASYNSSPVPGVHGENAVGAGGVGAESSRRSLHLHQRPAGLRNSLFVPLAMPVAVRGEEEWGGFLGGERERGRSVSAVEAGAGGGGGFDGAGGFRDGDGDRGEEGGKGGGGLRGRARSLSHTLGLAGLFGGGRGRRATVSKADGDGGAGGAGGAAAGEGSDGAGLFRARTASDAERGGDGSVRK